MLVVVWKGIFNLNICMNLKNKTGLHEANKDCSSRPGAMPSHSPRSTGPTGNHSGIEEPVKTGENSETRKVNLGVSAGHRERDQAWSREGAMGPIP